MKRKTQHAKILKAIRDLLWYHNIWHYKHAGGPFSKEGVADIIGILKSKDGKSLAIEVKVPGDQPTKKQAEFLQEVNDNGGIGFVAYSTEDVVDALFLPDLFI